MLCPRCNTQNRDNAKFCKVCGYSFTPEELAAAQNSSASAMGVQDTPQETPMPAANSSAEVTPSGAGGTDQAVSGDAQAVEVVVQPETPPQPAQGTTLPEDDISLMPTQILSQQEMEQFHARRWQREAGGTPVEVTTSPVGTTVPSADGNEQQPQPSAGVQQAAVGQIVSTKGVQPELATMSQNGDVGEDKSMQIPPPPPSEEQLAASGSNPSVSQYAEQAAAPPASVTPPEIATPVSLDTTPVGTDVSRPLTPSTDAPVSTEGQSTLGVGEHAEAVHVTDVSSSTPEGHAEVASTDASTLPVGTLVAGRYEVVQVLQADEGEHVYEVKDHQGYQQCWNCGSKENAQGDEFCIDCGAELLNASYLMHEYPSTASGSNDAHVLQGTIANTFVDGGKTYVIEQQHMAQLAFPNGVHILAASDSDAGNVRRSEPNEDSTLVLQLQRVHESHATPVGVFIIADGMGGHDNGQGASRMAINVIANKITRELLMPPLEAEKSGGLTASVPPMEDDVLVGVLKGAVEEANNVLVQTNQQDKTDMGSTLTGFMIVGDSAFIINVGDSRTYMLREDTLYQLTNDHSLVAQLLAGGLIEPDDVYTHPQRSQIFRSLGDKMNVQIDDFKQQLLPGDILLSCSDGLWEMVRNPQITEILKNAHDPQTACTQLIEAANANGGEDNVSAVVAFVR